MPIYEYECNACGERHEFIQKFDESPKRKCPSCGRLRLRKLVSAAAFHLKGDGWYVTDFRDKDKKKKSEPDVAKAESKSGADDTKSDPKPAGKAASGDGDAKRGGKGASAST